MYLCVLMIFWYYDIMNSMCNDNRWGINPRVIVSNMDDPISIDYTSVYERSLITYQTYTLIARFIGPTWCPSGADRTQVGPMLALWILLSGNIIHNDSIYIYIIYIYIWNCIILPIKAIPLNFPIKSVAHIFQLWCMQRKAICSWNFAWPQCEMTLALIQIGRLQRHSECLGVR